jgi:hypothetical protein
MSKDFAASVRARLLKTAKAPLTAVVLTLRKTLQLALALVVNMVLSC